MQFDLKIVHSKMPVPKNALNWQILVRHYKHKGQWCANPLSGGTAQKSNMKGIHRQFKKWRVQKRSNGQLRKWTYVTLQEAQRKSDVFLVVPNCRVEHWISFAMLNLHSKIN